MKAAAWMMAVVKAAAMPNRSCEWRCHRHLPAVGWWTANPLSPPPSCFASHPVVGTAAYRGRQRWAPHRLPPPRGVAAAGSTPAAVATAAAEAPL